VDRNKFCGRRANFEVIRRTVFAFYGEGFFAGFEVVEDEFGKIVLGKGY
jgi:hypothetical protein